MDNVTIFFLYGFAIATAFFGLMLKPKGFLLVVKIACILIFSACMYLLLK